MVDGSQIGAGMCGVVGWHSVYSDLNFKHFLNMIAESQIRGKHATGVSFYDGKKVVTVKRSVPAGEFLSQYEMVLREKFKATGRIISVAHTRYCTSGMEHSQPIESRNGTLVMNGVVTQLDPQHWSAVFGGEYTTTNDAEILSAYRDAGRLSELLVNHSSSVAFVHLATATTKNSQPVLSFLRNGSRPLSYVVTLDGVLAVGSTAEIFRRSGIDGHVESASVGVEYSVGEDLQLHQKVHLHNSIDLQEEPLWMSC